MVSLRKSWIKISFFYVTSDMNFASDNGKIVLITELVLDWRKPVRKVALYIRRAYRKLMWLDSHAIRTFE